MRETQMPVGVGYVSQRQTLAVNYAISIKEQETEIRGFYENVLEIGFKYFH